MATIEQSGALTNREQQVQSAYNDSTSGYIPLLQKQIDQAALDVNAANIAMQTANGNLTALQQGLAVMKAAGFKVSDIKPIKNWSLLTQTLNNSNATLLNSGGATSFSGNGIVAVPAPDITITSPSTIDAANLWILQAKKIIKNINETVLPNFSTHALAGYIDAGKTYVGFGPVAVQSIYDLTFGKTVSDLQAAINDLSGRLANYQASLTTTQASIDAQSTIVANAQAVYNTAAAKIVDLNKQMTQLQMQFQTDMASASDVDAQASQTALTLQLAANPDYQAGQLALQQAAAKTAADLEAQKETDATNAAAAALQAQTDLQKATIAQAQTAAQTQAQTDAANAAAKTASDAKQKTILIIGGVAIAVVVGVVLVLIFAD